MEAQEKITTRTLLIKNAPKQVENLASTLQTSSPSTFVIKSFGRRRALVTYENEEDARQALGELQNTEIMGKKLNVQIFRENVPKEQMCPKAAATTRTTNRKCNKLTQTTADVHLMSAETATPHINKYVRNLYACDAALGFEQPPLPYLKYAYPRITPDILDAISIALMSNTRFYTQVLHLMNRMNLEPPFGAKSATRTQLRVDPQLIELPNISDTPVVEEKEPSESELESSEDEHYKQKQQVKIISNVKRKCPPNEDQYKKKARRLLQSTLQIKHKQSSLPTPSTLQSAPSTSKNIAEVFEQSSDMKSQKIALNLKRKHESATRTTFLPPPNELSEQQLSAAEIEALPIFKNYQSGEPSNKLYIKNLTKDVTVDDLLALYDRFTAREHLDVKVMQSGRMKGQAFVTFNGLSEMDTVVVVANALKQTNGFVLLGKPMVVCYGKK